MQFNGHMFGLRGEQPEQGRLGTNQNAQRNPVGGRRQHKLIKHSTQRERERLWTQGRTSVVALGRPHLMLPGCVSHYALTLLYVLYPLRETDSGIPYFLIRSHPVLLQPGSWVVTKPKQNDVIIWLNDLKILNKHNWKYLFGNPNKSVCKSVNLWWHGRMNEGGGGGVKQEQTKSGVGA